MPRTSAWIASLIVLMLASATQAQAQFSIRAASAENNLMNPVPL